MAWSLWLNGEISSHAPSSPVYQHDCIETKINDLRKEKFMLQKYSYSLYGKHVNIPEIWSKQNPDDLKTLK